MLCGRGLAGRRGSATVLNARQPVRWCCGVGPFAAGRQCGRGSAGRASPCQGEGRGFESRRPLGGAGRRLAKFATTPDCLGGSAGTSARSPSRRAAGGGMAEWLRQGPAKPCTRVRFPLPPRGRLAQRESASLTRKRSLVQSQYRPQELPGTAPRYWLSAHPLGDYPGDYRYFIGRRDVWPPTAEFGFRRGW